MLLILFLCFVGFLYQTEAGICSQGYYTDRTTNKCELCSIGTFNHRREAETCIPCAKGQTTLQEGSKYRIHCLPGCGKGYYPDSRSGECAPCPIGTYNFRFNGESCRSCPEGHTTLQEGTKWRIHCLPGCGMGYYPHPTSGECTPCPIGTYNYRFQKESCFPCPSGRTTQQEESKWRIECVGCGKGYHPHPTTRKCTPCPIGTYNYKVRGESCIPCPEGWTTLQEGTQQRTQCTEALSAPDVWHAPDDCTGPAPNLYYSFNSNSSLTLKNGAEITPDGQVGSGLNGSARDSYIEYDRNLIPRCIYALTSDCKFTIAFWAKIPAQPSATLLSTFNISGDDNTGVSFGVGTPIGGGIYIRVTATTNATTVPEQLGISSKTLDSGVWHHIALTYHNSTHWALYVDFVDGAISHFLDLLEMPIYPALSTEAFMFSGFRIPPGLTGGGGRTRFGILDELVVFPEYLSAAPIMQLQISN